MQTSAVRPETQTALLSAVHKLSKDMTLDQVYADLADTSGGSHRGSPGMPLIDLTPWRLGSSAERQSVASAVDDALRTYGFLMLKGTGIPEQTPNIVRQELTKFFALPDAIKDRTSTRVGGRGWIRVGGEANSYSIGVETPPDLKETYAVSYTPPGESALVPNVWPADLPSLRAPVEAYLEAVWALAIELYELFAAALGLERDRFSRFIGFEHSNLNANWYPPLSRTGPPAQGQFRIGAHSDFGFLTILDRQPGYGGLQIEMPDGQWIDAPYREGTVTVNIGDLLARWTGDRWRSTSHRVLPPDSRAPDEALISLVNFFGVRPSTRIDTLDVGGPTRYSSVIAGDYVGAKLKAITV